jgi:hypothetical protein
MQTNAPSPLAEASPTSLDELFSLDPLQLTDENIDRIVLELRAQRDRWQQTEKKGRGKKAETVTLNLDDLGL